MDMSRLNKIKNDVEEAERDEEKKRLAEEEAHQNELKNIAKPIEDVINNCHNQLLAAIKEIKNISDDKLQNTIEDNAKEHINDEKLYLTIWVIPGELDIEDDRIYHWDGKTSTATTKFHFIAKQTRDHVGISFINDISCDTMEYSSEPFTIDGHDRSNPNRKKYIEYADYIDELTSSFVIAHSIDWRCDGPDNYHGGNYKYLIITDKDIEDIIEAFTERLEEFGCKIIDNFYIESDDWDSTQINFIIKNPLK